MAGKYASRNSQGDHAIARNDPKAISLLKEEHHVFRKLFDEAETAGEKRLVAIARELCMRLTVHMAIEEEILYPALKPIIGDDEINEGIVEHQSGKRIVAELEQLDGTEELFAAKIRVLGETLRERQAQLYDQIAKTGETGKTCEAQPDEVERA